MIYYKISNIMKDQDLFFLNLIINLLKVFLELNNLNIASLYKNKKFMNIILNKFFDKYKVGDKLIFPKGDMFWAKTKAIYQMFNLRLKFPEELGKINDIYIEDIEYLSMCLHMQKKRR